ncbi:MAG: nucleotidyltransferase domain-containing protein [Candidatus Heimdallarchaeaceae archaeon]
MTEKREKDQQYASKWRSIGIFIRNSTGLSVSGVARAGSRRKGEYGDTSDLDIIFAVSGDPPRDDVYATLETKLKEGFPKAKVKLGSSENVVKMFMDDLEFDIVLRREIDFKNQVQKYKLEQL